MDRYKKCSLCRKDCVECNDCGIYFCLGCAEVLKSVNAFKTFGENCDGCDKPFCAACLKNCCEEPCSVGFYSCKNCQN